MVALTRLTGGAPRCEPRNSPGDEGRLWRSSKPLQSRTQIARAHALGWRRTAMLRAVRAQGGRVAMGSRPRSENHLVQHSVGNSESTRSSSTNHPKLVRGMDGLVVCAMAGACRGRGFEPRFVRPSRGPSVRPPPPPPSASPSTTGTAGATGGVSPPFFPTHPPPPHPPPGGQRHTHTHTKRSTRHSTPAAARSVIATAVRRVAHVLLILLFRLPAEEDSNRGLQGGGQLRKGSTMLRKTRRKSGPPIPAALVSPPP